MDDNTIIDLYWQRNEDAINQSSQKYGHYCKIIAQRILENIESSDECVNDTWLNSWNSIPPDRKSTRLNSSH